MKIEDKTVVSIDYTLTDDNGAVIDTSKGEGGEPLKFLQGVGMIIPGLEKALVGKVAGDKFKVSIEPEEGYGHRNDEMVQVVPASELAHLGDLEVGVTLNAQTDAGDSVTLIVVEVNDKEITLDGNHPLAGQKLHFDCEILEVRAATDEEIEHGHNH